MNHDMFEIRKIAKELSPEFIVSQYNKSMCLYKTIRQVSSYLKTNFKFIYLEYLNRTRARFIIAFESVSKSTFLEMD